MLKQAARALLLTVFLLGPSLVLTYEVILSALFVSAIAIASALSIIRPELDQGYAEMDRS